MDSSELKKILDDHKLWLEDHSKGARADLHNADLRDVDLSDADLHNADLGCTDLSYANLHNADLSCADLSCANLRNANLCNTDLSHACLSHAALSHADLRNANVRIADLDFSCWGLSCKTFDVSVSMRLVYQLCYHICRLKCENEEFVLIKNFLKPFANKFHHVDECGKIE